MPGSPRSSLRRSLALLCALGAGSGAEMAGCSSVPPPRFVVQGVSVTEQTGEGMVLSFVVEGENRNNKALPLREVNYGLSLDGREVFRGRRSAEVTLSRFGARTITLPVAIAITEDRPAPKGEVSYRFSGTVVYEVPGAFAETLFENRVRRPSASFSETGRLTITDPGFIGPEADDPAARRAPERTPSANPTP